MQQIALWLDPKNGMKNLWPTHALWLTTGQPALKYTIRQGSAGLWLGKRCRKSMLSYCRVGWRSLSWNFLVIYFAHICQVFFLFSFFVWYSLCTCFSSTLTTGFFFIFTSTTSKKARARFLSQLDLGNRNYGAIKKYKCDATMPSLF